MQCKICQKEAQKSFRAKILNKYDVSFFQCSKCGFLQSEEPFWIQEAYENSINVVDTGIMQRNLLFSEITALIIFFLFDSKGVFLDSAGGYGIFTRLMRDIGFDFYWNDLFTKNLLARGFEESKIKNKKIELLTSFECFEHFADPIREIEKLLVKSENILFSTTVLPEPVPDKDSWWYYGFSHGQHISFYRVDTLRTIADKFGLKFYTNGKNIHLFTKKRFSNFVFDIILKSRKPGLAYLVKKKMKSLTLKDMNTLEENTQNYYEN